jgi:hypothetical protein
MSRQQTPTLIEDIVCSKNVATTNYRCVSYWDSSTIFNTLESISLNQIELRRNLKETVLAVSQKDRKQRDRMLDYLEKRIERDDKQIRGT